MARLPSLYLKTLLTLLVSVVLVVITGGWLGSRALERQAIVRLADALERTARVMQPDVLAAFATPPALQGSAEILGRRAGCRVTIVSPDGTVLGDSGQTVSTLPLMDNHRGRPEVADALRGRVSWSLRYSTTVRSPMLYLALPLAQGDRLLGVLRVALPVTEVEALRGEIRRTMLVNLLIGLGLAVALGAWLAGRLTRPLNRLTAVARAYARDEFDLKPVEASVREVRELTDALTAMMHATRSRIQDLTTERNQAKAILHSMVEGVLALDGDGRVRWLSPSAERLFGLVSTQATGKRLTELVRQPELDALVSLALKSGQPAAEEIRFLGSQEQVVRFQAAPCERGQTHTALVLVAQDVTQLRRLEGLRREFVANVSHELKTPLTSIKGLVETLLTGALEDPQHNRRFVSLIDEDATRLGRLIDDLLELSQIESGAVSLTLQPVNLRVLLEQIIPVFKSQLSDRIVGVDLELTPDTPPVVGDPERLREVFVNLLDNAIKFNKPGGRVMISAEREGDLLRVSVEDTGLGIPAEDLPRIFERFYRVDKARSRELGGTGLGLAIVKHLVELHGGRVEVRSRLDQGSTFSILLPLASS